MNSRWVYERMRKVNQAQATGCKSEQRIPDCTHHRIGKLEIENRSYGPETKVEKRGQHVLEKTLEQRL